MAGDNSELKEVRNEISELKKKLSRYNLEELAVSEDAASLRLYEILRADKERLVELQKEKNILLQQQQQQGDLTRPLVLSSNHSFNCVTTACRPIHCSILSTSI